VIKLLILSKKLQFRTIKVKGYAGIVDNKKADELAKRAVEQVKNKTLEIVNLIDEEVRHRISYNMKWNNIHIDSPLRKYNRLVNNSLVNSHWSLGSIWKSPTWNDIWSNKHKEATYTWVIW